MASKELVGRPLVPFFDSDDNVNDALELADDAHEQMDVDARVWDKELGYFVYPSERSEPVAIPTRESRSDSGKLLLTPSMMLSSSAPESFNATGNPVAADVPRSSSTKRGAKKKSRADTPVRRRAKDDDKAAKKGKKQSNGKQKPQAASGSGKWAWSAFQSSPDPAQLPMPPFLTKPDDSAGNYHVDAAAPPLPPPMHHQPVPVAPPLPGQPPLPPGQPPLPAGPPPLPPGQPPLPLGQPPLPSGQPPLPPEVTAAPAMSIELSMTQDLRRMLNIGGG